MELSLLDSRQSILVVEDDETLRTLFRALLGRAGFHVDCLSDGSGVMETLATAHYDAIILDLMMPRVDGFEVLRRFTAEAPALLRRTIVTTGISNKQLEEIDGAGVFAIVRKPFDVKELVEIVMACVGGGPSGDTERPPRRAVKPADSDGGAHLHSMYDSVRARFAEHAPELRMVLQQSPLSHQEVLLRSELRRVVGELRSAFDRAARIEPDRARAADFTRFALLADGIAGAHVPLGRSRHEH